MAVITEIVHMHLQKGMEQDTFLGIVNQLEETFHSKQLGFLDSELTFDEKENVWIMIQHWESEELLKAASKKMFTDDKTIAFREAIVPKKIKMQLLKQRNIWNKMEQK